MSAKPKFIFSCLICICLSVNLTAQKENIFQYFYNKEGVPVIKIETDTKKLYRKKMAEEYQPAVFSFSDNEGKQIDVNVKIRARGNMRKRQCNYPPIKVNFQKEDLKSMGLKKMDNLKMVFQCANTKSSREELFKEKMIYDLYEVIDTNVILTKLVKIEMWKDGELDVELDGFIIEDEEQFAARKNAKIIESGNIRSASLDRSHYLKMVFFQYMIANTDWSIPNKHNVEIVALPGYIRTVAIPYDFDYAGFVGTSYAVPHESLPIQDVRVRHFQGFQVNEGEAMATANHFLQLQDNFNSAIDRADYCEERTIRDAKDFISEFYRIIKSDKKVKATFTTTAN